MRLTSLLTFLSISAAVCSAQTAAPVQSAVAPHYHPIAVAARVTGTVSVRVHIDSQGGVVSAEVIDGPRLLKLGAEDTAKLWKFEPASDTDRTATLKFVYVLLGETADAEYEVKFKPSYEVVIEKHPAKSSVSYGTSAQASPSSGVGVAHEAGHAQGASVPEKP